MLDDFKQKWIRDLKHDGFLIGVNWSGENLEGYDLDPDMLLKAINHYAK